MKKKSVQWMVLAVIFSLVFTTIGLSGCSFAGANVQQPEAEEEEEETEPEEQIPLPEDAKVGICMNASSQGYERAYYSRLEKYLVERGFSADNIYLEESVTGEEKTAILSLMAQECDVILADCGEPQNAPAVRKIAVELQIPMVFIITEPEEEELKYWEENQLAVAYVGGDRSKIGELRETILDEIPFDTLDASGDHFIGCMILDTADKSVEGVDANAGTLEALEADHYKTKTLVHAAFGEEQEEGNADFSDWSLDTEVEQISYESYEDAVAEIGALIKEHRKEVEVILCANDMLAMAAIEAVSDNKRSIGHDVQILGAEATEESLEAVAAGELLGTIFNDYLAQSRKGADAALAFFKGEKVPYYTYCDYVRVTDENAREILDVAAEAFAQEDEEEEESED